MAELTDGIFRIPKRVMLAETIADSVARAIATGFLKPDERVTETALADRIGVSRAPIRDALKVLHAQGIVTEDSSRGYRVAAFDDDTIQKVLEVRLLLEAILLRDAVCYWRSHDPAATALNVPIARMHEAAANDDRAASLEADLSFHRAIADAAHNLIVQTLWSAIARHVMIIFSRYKYRADDLYSVVRHHELFRDFIREQTRKESDPAVLRSELENYLLQVSRMRPSQQP
ncbi:MAG: GntR family transcriptional regulator [Pseudorhodobacter sp.]|nr:GntR family transcriptional regulator [Pseudorhodobacter sp.]